MAKPKDDQQVDIKPIVTNIVTATTNQTAKRKEIVDKLQKLADDKVRALEDDFVDLYDMAKDVESDKSLHDTIINCYINILCPELLEAKKMQGATTCLLELLDDPKMSTIVTKPECVMTRVIYNGIKRKRSEE